MSAEPYAWGVTAKSMELLSSCVKSLNSQTVQFWRNISYSTSQLWSLSKSKTVKTSWQESSLHPWHSLISPNEFQRVYIGPYQIHHDTSQVSGKSSTVTSSWCSFWFSQLSSCFECFGCFGLALIALDFAFCLGSDCLGCLRTHASLVGEGGTGGVFPQRYKLQQMRVIPHPDTAKPPIKGRIRLNSTEDSLFPLSNLASEMACCLLELFSNSICPAKARATTHGGPDCEQGDDNRRICSTEQAGSRLSPSSASTWSTWQEVQWDAQQALLLVWKRPLWQAGSDWDKPDKQAIMLWFSGPILWQKPCLIKPPATENEQFWPSICWEQASISCCATDVLPKTDSNMYVEALMQIKDVATPEMSHDQRHRWCPWIKFEVSLMSLQRKHLDHNGN